MGYDVVNGVYFVMWNDIISCWLSLVISLYPFLLALLDGACFFSVLSFLSLRFSSAGFSSLCGFDFRFLLGFLLCIGSGSSRKMSTLSLSSMFPPFDVGIMPCVTSACLPALRSSPCFHSCPCAFLLLVSPHWAVWTFVSS